MSRKWEVAQMGYRVDDIVQRNRATHVNPPI